MRKKVILLLETLLRRRGLNATRVVAISFALIILTGALLLTLPIASRDGESAGFFTALFTSLWGLLAMVPYFVVLTVGAMAQSYALIMFSTVLALLAVVVEIAVSYRYRLATYFLLDDMNMGVLASIRESKQTMHGRKGALFVMDLSFLGWGLLSLITFGVVGLWASPYMWAAEANFYHWARWGTFPGEGPQPGGPQPGGYQSPYQKF